MKTIDDARSVIKEFDIEVTKKIKDICAQFPECEFKLKVITMDSIDPAKPPQFIRVKSELVIFVK